MASYILNKNLPPHLELSTLERLRITLVLVPSMTLVVVFLAVGDILYVCRKITTGSYFFIRSDFGKSRENALIENLKDKLCRSNKSTNSILS